MSSQTTTSHLVVSLGPPKPLSTSSTNTNPGGPMQSVSQTDASTSLTNPGGPIISVSNTDTSASLTATPLATTTGSGSLTISTSTPTATPTPSSSDAGQFGVSFGLLGLVMLAWMGFFSFERGRH